jgi:hypothetical protein
VGAEKCQESVSYFLPLPLPAKGSLGPLSGIWVALGSPSLSLRREIVQKEENHPLRKETLSTQSYFWSSGAKTSKLEKNNDKIKQRRSD